MSYLPLFFQTLTVGLVSFTSGVEGSVTRTLAFLNEGPIPVESDIGNKNRWARNVSLNSFGALVLIHS